MKFKNDPIYHVSLNVNQSYVSADSISFFLCIIASKIDNCKHIRTTALQWHWCENPWWL